MTLDPLLKATSVIQIHTALALGAVLLTVAIFAVKRGTKLHKGIRRVWVTMMALVAISSFWLFELQVWGNYSPIHLLSIFALFQLFRAVQAARRGEITRHERTMKGLIFGALMVAEPCMRSF